MITSSTNISKSSTTDLAFSFHHYLELHVAIVAVMMLLTWGVAYMSIINNNLFFWFNESDFNSLLGFLLGLLLNHTVPLKSIMKFFLPWDNFENNILPFMVMYPASKISGEHCRKQIRLTFFFAVLTVTLCVLLNACAFSTLFWARPESFLAAGEGKVRFHHVLLAMYISSSISLYDAYLCVHNFPEIRGNGNIRAFLSTSGLIAMTFALELRQISLNLTLEAKLQVFSIVLTVLKQTLFVPLVSVLLGLTAGLVSSYITKHSSFLSVQQEMVVLPCSNYFAYTVAQKTGLSPIITSVTCEVVQSNYSINNISEASKITYSSMLAKSSKLLAFFCTLSMGYHFGANENRQQLWRFISVQIFVGALGATVVIRIFCSVVAYWCVKRLGFQMRSCTMFLYVMIHTRATPSLMSLINLENYSKEFQICPDHLKSFQWTLYIMCNFVNIINVPLVGLLYKKLRIEPEVTENQAQPIFHVIFRLMYHEMHQQIIYLSGERRGYDSIYLMLGHMKKSFSRYVMSLGFMSVPERHSQILGAYDRTLSQRSNVIDQRRNSVRSKKGMYANHVCASFIVRNLAFEGFCSDDLAEYFLVTG